MALPQTRIVALGDELFDALRARRTLAPLTERVAGIDIDDAYNISLHFLHRRTASGEALIGKKIGVTSKPVQDMLGVHQPDRSEEHTSELQSIMRISYAVFCL